LKPGSQREAALGAGRLLRVLEASPERRSAPCRFYDAAAAARSSISSTRTSWRRRRASWPTRLRRIGGIEDARALTSSPSPLEFRYRNRVVVHAAAHCAAPCRGRLPRAGPARQVLDIDDGCLLPEPAVADAWGALRGVGPARIAAAVRSCGCG
jgi:23S rRNA (uracil1939-C5)-methyltransferase